MKRSVVIAVIVLSLCFSLSISVFAATVNSDNGSSSKDVIGSYARTGEAGNIYCVDITWGDMEFTYNAPAKTWHPETHSYEETSVGSWSCDSGADTVTISNHSNVEVKTTVTYTPSADNGVAGTIDNPSFVLNAPEENSAQEAAPSDSAKLTLSPNNLPSSFTDGSQGVILGSITVSISGNTAVQDAEWLKTALADSGTAALTDDLSLDEALSIDSGTVTLDLGGNTLTLPSITVAKGANLTITNGTIETENGIVNNGTLAINGVNISSSGSAAISLGNSSSVTVIGSGVISSATGYNQIFISASDTSGVKINLSAATAESYNIGSKGAVDEIGTVITVPTGYKIYDSGGINSASSISSNGTVIVK